MSEGREQMPRGREGVEDRGSVKSGGETREMTHLVKVKKKKEKKKKKRKRRRRKEREREI